MDIGFGNTMQGISVCTQVTIRFRFGVELDLCFMDSRGSLSHDRFLIIPLHTMAHLRGTNSIDYLVDTIRKIFLET